VAQHATVSTRCAHVPERPERVGHSAGGSVAIRQRKRDGLVDRHKGEYVCQRMWFLGVQRHDHASIIPTFAPPGSSHHGGNALFCSCLCVIGQGYRLHLRGLRSRIWPVCHRARPGGDTT
jgi:hypothetical protein